MTTTTLTRSSRLTTGGVLRSEWVKLVTLRSTAWCLAIVAALGVGIPTLLALALPTPDGGGDPEVGFYDWMMATTLPVVFTSLVVAVLGCLVITGEYGTGMIRSTMTAVPRRIPALLAKAAVLGLTVLVASGAVLAVGAAVSGAVLGARGVALDPTDPRVWQSLLGAAGFLTLLAVFALGLGTVIRHSAGAIAAVLGLLLVVPTIVQLAGGLLRLEWLVDAGGYLPSSLGSAMYSPPVPVAGAVTGALEPWQAALGLAAWALVALVGAALVVRRRDV
ncbi:ABC transporter permease [Pseudolysinimonas sp.]